MTDSLTWDSGGFHERDAAYYAAVGFLCHQWNTVESLFYGLPCDIMKVGREFHPLLFRHLGIKVVQTFLEEYAVSFLHDADTVAQIKHLNAYIEICRVNRNMIVHGHPTHDTETAEAVLWMGSDKNRRTKKVIPRSVELVRQCCDDCEVAGRLIISLQFFFMPEEVARKLETQFDDSHEPGAWRARLRARPPLPKSLVPVQAPNPPKKPASPRPPQA